jgi:uncharacterized damage-inducible protein DinB
MNCNQGNCRKLRAFVMAGALLAAGMMVQTTAQAQTGTAAKAKAKTADSMAAESPSATYSKLLKIMSSEVIGAAEAMPADKYDFAPTNGNFSGVRTFGDQVKHLASANYGFFRAFGVPGVPDRKTLAALKGKEEIVQALKDSYAYAQKSIDTMTPQNAFETVGSGEGRMTRAGLAAFCVAHSMDHYGQMVEYLRMNSIVPPASRNQGQGGM